MGVTYNPRPVNDKYEAVVTSFVCIFDSGILTQTVDPLEATSKLLNRFTQEKDFSYSWVSDFGFQVLARKKPGRNSLPDCVWPNRCSLMINSCEQRAHRNARPYRQSGSTAFVHSGNLFSADLKIRTSFRFTLLFHLAYFLGWFNRIKALRYDIVKRLFEVFQYLTENLTINLLF